MRRRFLIPLLLLVLTLAGLSSCNKNSSTPAPSSNTITIHDNYYDPASLTVSVGTTVVWRDSGANPHTVTSGTPTVSPGALFDSGTLNNGGGFTFVFGQPGTYTYFCRFTGESGSITVQ